jgi:hypothetical protein
MSITNIMNKIKSQYTSQLVKNMRLHPKEIDFTIEKVEHTQ